jgi:hypothetical protein
MLLHYNYNDKYDYWRLGVNFTARSDHDNHDNRSDHDT